MEKVIKNQKVAKRKSRNNDPRNAGKKNNLLKKGRNYIAGFKKTKNRNGSASAIQSRRRNSIEAFFHRLSVLSKVRKLFAEIGKKLDRGRKKFGPSWMLWLPITLLIMAAVFTISAFHMHQELYVGQGGLAFPERSEVQDLLYNYIEPESEWHLAEETRTIDPNQFASLEMSKYKVVAGDTLSGIAQKFDLNMDTLVSFNQIKNVRRMQIGTVFQIPNRDGLMYRVKRGDSLSSISVNFNITVNALLDANNLESTNITVGQDLFIPEAKMDSTALKIAIGEAFANPVWGRFTSGYGMRNDPFTGVLRFHNGIDLSNAPGTPIRAAMEGRVARVESQIGNYGKYIILVHPGGYQTLYAHLDSFSVSVGQWVNQGQLIGKLGNTGRSTGPHLHFSIFRNGKALNPLDHLANL